MSDRENTRDKDGLPEAEQQKLAIERLIQMFADAGEAGISQEKMVIVALSATLNQMVAVFGEGKTAAILETVPEKVMAGHFTTQVGTKQ